MSLVGKILLNRFRVDAFIASGGMSDVYRVWDTERNVPLAMKVLHLDLADDPSMLKRFEREGRALKKLAHPHIIPFYGIFQVDDLTFLLEQYVDGPTLKHILSQRKGSGLSPLDALIYLKALSTALGYAHSNGVVHCDVKPGNVMVDTGGNIFLTDFGITRHSESTTTTLGTAGTPAYMAPEQIRGDPVTPATDVYALGILLFEMLTGKRPFRGDEASSKGSASTDGSTAAERVRIAHLTLPAPDPRTLNADIPDELAQVVLTALAKDPTRRYRSTLEMLDCACAALGLTLTQIADRVAPLQVEPPAVPPPPARRVAILATRRKPIVVASLFLLFLFAVGIVALAFFSRQRVGTPAVSIAASPTTISANTPTFIKTKESLKDSGADTMPAVTGTATPETVTSTPTEVPTTLSPTATETAAQAPALPVIGGADKIAYLNDNDAWVVNIDGSQLTRLTEDGAIKINLQWTPDGQAVKYISGKCIYLVWLSDRRKETLTCFNFAEYIKAFEFSSDGKQVALSLDNQLYILPNDWSLIRSVSVRGDLNKIAQCKDFAPYTRNFVKFTRWSKDSQKLAMVIMGHSTGIGSVDLIQVIAIDQCTPTPDRLDNFPRASFHPSEYTASPMIPNFGWDGLKLFAMATFIRNQGFGNLYIYNMDVYKGQKVNPVGGACCYRDPIWSPDGSHLLFAFQKWPGGDGNIQLYYIPYGTIGTGVTYNPLPLPPIDLKSQPQPALRPAP